MRRIILAACAAALLAPTLPNPACWAAQYRYPPPGGNDQPEQLVGQWYRQFLGRQADPMSSVWVEQLRAGQTPEAVLSQIVGSTEYYIRAGNSPEAFVARLHRDLAGRPLARTEVAFWVNQLYRSDRSDVAYQMMMRYPQQWGGPGPDDREPDYRRPLYRYR